MQPPSIGVGVFTSFAAGCRSVRCCCRHPLPPDRTPWLRRALGEESGSPCGSSLEGQGAVASLPSNKRCPTGTPNVETWHWCLAAACFMHLYIPAPPSPLSQLGSKGILQQRGATSRYIRFILLLPSRLQLGCWGGSGGVSFKLKYPTDFRKTPWRSPLQLPSPSDPSTMKLTENELMWSVSEPRQLVNSPKPPRPRHRARPAPRTRAMPRWCFSCQRRAATFVSISKSWQELPRGAKTPTCLQPTSPSRREHSIQNAIPEEAALGTGTRQEDLELLTEVGV